ncbi:imidazole glycerol phosphate synthase subunit HisH [Chryseobacterium sp. HSC-36S06]|uniref:imidazole glycerol phosphate synthase subunit HisH n=1 Tax=Chryseobacterium sp. HSC-36S06 TaxID=2910970 RepID=UPI00209EF507|nr:imidazole glycerol phosphate synthase subunit HisH [Chryseobacterium sp. HSC-36S06]MCP2038734.1 glutamine amidotransferase [Chryseobacterium sp. HSC-36S06]
MIAILKYNAGNATSVENAVQRLGYETVITDDIAVLKAAEKVILPGVGEAASAMNYLKEKGLDEVIKSLKQPVLGICLGMQLLCESSEEGDTQTLGVFNTKVKKFPPEDLVPHTGWNNFTAVKGKLFENVRVDENCYFVHSYYAEISDETVAVTDYILPFSAALQKDNFYATQFHPEKSAPTGLQILKNFLSL